jgi:hypothetical protein
MSISAEAESNADSSVLSFAGLARFLRFGGAMCIKQMARNGKYAGSRD